MDIKQQFNIIFVLFSKQELIDINMTLLNQFYYNLLPNKFFMGKFKKNANYTTIYKIIVWFIYNNNTFIV